MSHQKFPNKPDTMKSLSILIFNWRCWLNPEVGGTEVFTYENAKRRVKAGHAVTFWASEFPRTPSTFMAIEDIVTNDCNGGAW